MSVIICKDDKHLVTLYNVILSNMTGILSHLSYIFYQHKRAAMCHWHEIYWETYLSYQTNTLTVISPKTLGARQVLGQNGIDITWNNDQTANSSNSKW